MGLPGGDQEKIHAILDKIEPVVKGGNLEEFKVLIQILHDVHDKTLLNSCYNNRGIHLISLICEYSNRKLLRYLLYRSHILHYLTSDDKSKELEFKEIAFYFAMRSNNFEILEMLYDYWSGDLHWLGHKKEYNEFDVDNLHQLNHLLSNAFNKYEDRIQKKEKVDRLMMYNIQSLMAFNDFQRDIYERLNKLKTALITWEDEPKDIIRNQETHVIRSMIIAIIDMYEKHSKKEFCEKKEDNSTQRSDTENLDGYIDENTDNVKMIKILTNERYVYTTHEAYYRKLDFNVCLLILDNLHLLKLRLSMPKDSYQKLENKLYHFYYHVSNNWRLYLPKRKKLKSFKILGKYKDVLCTYKLNCDVNKWENFREIMYLERGDFENTINRFKNELKNRNIEGNLRKEKSRLSNENHNYLQLIPELRDDYSLKMMSRLIGQLYSIDFKTEYAVLLIERTLQVVGEFLKSTDESLHLEQSTEALLKAEISVEVINDLKILRNMLCHAKNGILLKRIELEKGNNNIFTVIRKELLHVKRKIDKVIKVHKPLVQRALLQNTKSILCERRNEMPTIVAVAILYILNLLKYIPNDCGQFYKKIWTPFGFLKSVVKEITMLVIVFLQVESKLSRVHKTIHNNITNEFPFYRNVIEYSLKKITDDTKKWIEIVKAIKEKDSSANLLKYPNENDANRMKSYSKQFDLGDEIDRYLKDVTMFAHIEHHWKFVGNLLEFVVIKSCIFNDTIEDLQIRTRLEELKEYDYKSNEFVDMMTKYLDRIEKCLQKNNKNKTNTNVHPSVHPSQFKGIKELTYKLSQPNFLTNEEKSYLLNIIQNIPTSSNKKLSIKNQIINKIENDIAIPMTIYKNFIISIALDVKAQKILKNLVMGCERDPLILHCLNNRISVLKEVTTNLDVNQLVLRYKLDTTFRVLLEILLFDIFDILEGNNKNTEIVKKSSKLLMEINLRNMLTHGSPLLEVVGDVLDSNDLPTELVTKAVEFIKDKKSIDALCALNDSGFFSQINNNAIHTQQVTWMNEFKRSPRWKDYIRLVPEYKQKIYENPKKTLATPDKSNKLIKAVQKKDYSLVQQSIYEGADVNYIDTHKKAAIHYAAMKGDILMMKILKKNGADINTRNAENNLTALHYSAMNNFKDAVEYLLENKADCLAMDGKGRTPAYLANERNFLNISRIILRKMRTCE